MLGKEKYNFDLINETDEIGIVRGLAWTSVGGDTLQIEVNLMPGKGDFQLTGQLGDVMKESAQAGISYIRSVSEAYGIDKEFFKENDIHIHILKEKILAAKNAGIKTICVPKKNEPDVLEIAQEIKKGLEIVFVGSMEQVLEVALVKE